MAQAYLPSAIVEGLGHINHSKTVPAAQTMSEIIRTIFSLHGHLVSTVYLNAYSRFKVSFIPNMYLCSQAFYLLDK